MNGYCFLPGAHGAVASHELGADTVGEWLSREPNAGGKLGARLRVGYER